MTAHPDTPTGRATSLLAALTLAACSWQASATDADHGASDALAAEAAALLPPVSVPPPPPVPPDECSTLGQWGSVIAWTPHIPVSAANLPDGRILTFASNQRTTFPAGAEFTYAATWHPSTGAFVEYNHPSHDMFCGALVTLPDGRIVVNGGRATTVRASVFDWRNNTWTRLADMNDTRWYNTSVAMPDGTVFTVSGSGGSNTAERWNTNNTWTRLTGVGWASVTAEPGYINIWHPFIELTPDGRLFHFGPTDTMHWLTTGGTGSLTSANLFVPSTHYPKEGTFAMYDEGKILVAGGGANTTAIASGDGTTGTSTTLAYSVNLNTTPPTITTLPSMAYARQFANSTVLPSGEVLVMGGNTSGLKFNDSGSILTPEIYNPRTNSWRSVAPFSVPRNYHAVTLLLPDGRVWLAGGGLSGNSADHRDAQIYTPPCLFNADGTAATRPTLTTAPTKIGAGTVFSVQGTADIRKFAFIKMSAITHCVNTDLRYLSLPFTETSAGNYAITARSNLNVMTPGHWMLFGIGANGAHSISKVIQVDGAFTVQIDAVANQNATVGAPATVALSGTAPTGVTKVFSATGLPPGLTVTPATGVIAGTPTTAGTYTVAATLTAGGNVSTTQFTWSVLSNDGMGGIKREWWLNLTGSTLADLTGNAAYPNSPTGTDTLTAFETPTNWADNHGQRVRGWLRPSLTGQYRFWIASDDESRLLLSTDATAANATIVARVPAYTASREWTKYPEQASALITLEANKRYYIEALVKEGGGDDNLAVAWQPPGAASSSVIPGSVLSLYATPPNNHAPTLTNPGAQTNVANTALSVPIVAADADGNTLAFSASALPAGLSINPSTGVISGTPTTTGTSAVTVSVTDAIAAPVSVTFNWTINSPLAVQPLTAAPAAVGTTLTYTAQTTGGLNPKFSWNYGDGTAPTAFSATASTSHAFAAPGRYAVVVTVRDDTGREVSASVRQAVYAALTTRKPNASSPIAWEARTTGNPRLWVCNPDNDTVSVFDTVTRTKAAEIAVGTTPRSIAVAPDGRVWVVNHQSATLTIVNATTLTVASTVNLPRASRPFGLAFDPDGTDAWLCLEGTGQLLRLSPSTGATVATLAVGQHARHVSVTADSTRLLVSRFITPRLPGEETATVQTTVGTTSYGGEVLSIATSPLAISSTIVLKHSEQPDTEISAKGIPNYLGAAAISPDGTSAWVPSKQDNIKRGTLRSGLPLTHDMTIRMVASRINMATGAEDLASRVDYDNAGIPSAAAFDPRGLYLFTALEGSREVAVTDVWARREILRFAVGRAPQGLVVSPDGLSLYVMNFMDRTVTVHSLADLMAGGEAPIATAATLAATATEKLTATVLKGKQFFYDSRDARIALQQYVSCAACHNDGAQDGRVWDFTGFGEGLRNTITLRGHGGTAQGALHWSGNFDEVQDFEGQIRGFAGGTGLMDDVSFHTGTRDTPLGTPKTGVSADLDALAAYVASLTTEDPNPTRNADGSMTAAAIAGKEVFRTQNCAQCHTGTGFTNSAVNVFANIGTIKPTSGNRLGGTLSGLDVPTLRGLWNTGPYLHDGSAATIAAAVQAHQGVTLTATDLTNLVAYLGQIDATETSAPAPAAPSVTLSAPASASGPFSVSVAATAGLVGLTASDFTVTNGTAGALTGSGSAYSLTIAPTAAGSVTVRLPANAATTSTNVGNAASNTTTTAYQPNRAPTLTQPADQSTQRGSTASLQLAASDPDGNTLTYSASGLPTGLTIGSGTGLISGTVSASAAATNSVTVTVSDGQLNASRTFNWATTAPPVTDVPVPGLKGEYFTNATVTGSPAVTRIDSLIFNYWPETAPPAQGIPGDNFSARWTGRLKPPTSETYTFYLDVDDGARLWVNGQLIIDRWNPTPNTYFDVPGTPIALTANQLVDLKLEYQDFYSDAYVVLKWQTPTRPRDIIGTAYYFQPPSGPDTTPPAVSLTAASGTVSGAFDVTVTVTEPVTGVAASDFTITNGTAGALSGSGANYVLRVTPVAAGAVTVKMPANACIDAASNGNTLSNTLSVTYTPPPANRAPVVTAVANQTSSVNTTATLQIVASDPDGQALTYSITGQPLGLTINPTTGLISGTVSASAASTNNVTVSASDGSLTGSASFVWTIVAAPPPQGLLGEYYTGADFGTLVTARTDPTVDFYWPEGSAPAAGMPHDYFSVRWSGQVTPQFSESYRFYADCDDGIRIYVNGTLVLDKWNPAPNTYFGLQSSAISLTAGQAYDFRVDFQDFYSDAYVQIRWSSPSQPQQVIPSSRLTPARRNGLTGRYFNGKNFESLAVEQIDPTVNYYWNTSSPISGVNSDGFSVRWTGCVVPSSTGAWNFHVTADDGARLWINDTLLIDTWASPTTTEQTGTISLTTGVPATLKLEYFENTGAARCELRWSSATVARQIIPTAKLLVNESTMAGLFMRLPPVESPVSASLAAVINNFDETCRSLRLQADGAGGLQLSFNCPLGLADAGLFTVESSDDAVGWKPLTGTFIQQIRDLGDGWEAVTLGGIPLNAEGRPTRLYRIKASGP